MRKALAAVMSGGGAPVEIREVDVPELEMGSALLAVELSEVCGTDVHLRHGRLQGVPYPIIPGHVCVGRLTAIRGEIRDVTGRVLTEGERVTFLDVHETCHACWYCLVARASTRCPKRKVYGITYGLADGLTGGWATHVVLKPGVKVIPLGDLSPERFMAGGCAMPTALHAMELARVKLQDTVVILGAGPVGLTAVGLSRLSGAGRVLCLGAPQARLRAARAMGADSVLDIAHHAPDARARWIEDENEGRLADVTLEATGAPAAVVEAMRFTRDGGRVIVVGQYTDGGDVSLNPHRDLNRKHLEILGCWGSDYSHFHRAKSLLSHDVHGALWDGFELERFDLAQADAALDAVASGRVVKALVVPPTMVEPSD